ncbi:hypothetical protein G6F57_002460 [Rhizopus arrhizus]|uniref:Brix domain-containing protein n=1 Tax=Rhizopus oryzae TaxID=64495 RepID=A0A9P6XG70_RHIOR|nr:hypothetical protein G6F23_006159 [Rhizopus arrhizus]KAG1419862.1 hypothetical protein G6F58_004415 [Rhizopus delemar]KAG0768243.1 hypothetical protein G6F24_002111 [Rhizopus arrhizus]KAG0796021.1 hypothetical protein G6F21_001638 [Rhizopus arrhizus]KAG0802428.1 hypothetical protein G6F22_000274 [Rhizopus arrhizus]
MSAYKALTKKNSEDKRINKQRVMMLCSRGVTYRYRHLMNDLEGLLPHSKKDAKLDTKNNLYILNELADLNNCNNAVFFETRKKQDLYVWMAKTPNGPSVKFHLQNLHTMDELKMTGNCLKGSRHILSFDKTFDSAPHWSLLKELLGQVFNVPKGTRRSKPFIDHVLSFSIVDNRVWFRNYQASPRFCLTPIRIFEGSFGGPTVYENPEFVHPNFVRAAMRKSKLVKYAARQKNNTERNARLSMAKESRETEVSDKSVFK